ncbi:hypothetical protein BOO69_08730 [Sulfitobacter alexandrii]|uniref:Uncharacterized protein n=1 Tax=Sulfitobacter alexandrii TaxID=1917485 RepID=A0A1J0WH78_9RHOB|nr:hypothetical protein [Sulfitobacter alexandrii]APE43486.1 hypothetical protein BOO69_08730 [Sulfitobacter alexandrii]
MPRRRIVQQRTAPTARSVRIAGLQHLAVQFEQPGPPRGGVIVDLGHASAFQEGATLQKDMVGSLALG